MFSAYQIKTKQNWREKKASEDLRVRKKQQTPNTRYQQIEHPTSKEIAGIFSQPGTSNRSLKHFWVTHFWRVGDLRCSIESRSASKDLRRPRMARTINEGTHGLLMASICPQSRVKNVGIKEIIQFTEFTLRVWVCVGVQCTRYHHLSHGVFFMEGIVAGG